MSDPMYKLYTKFKPPKDPNETHAPKLLRGKVALCKDCGCFSRDISQCIGCKKKFPEGTLKVLLYFIYLFTFRHFFVYRHKNSTRSTS